MNTLITQSLRAVIFGAASLFFLSRPVLADDPLPSTNTLEGLVSRWVDLRLQIAQEKERWKEQKLGLEQERELLLKEKEALTEEIEQARQEQTSAEAERASLLKEKEALMTSLDGTLPALSRAEAGLKIWPGLLPPSLAAPLRKMFDKLNTAAGRPVSERIQVILSLYGEIERIQQSVHLVKETLAAGSGRSQEMDVIYLGLARGFAVSPDDTLAATGYPTRGGWKWEWKPDIAPIVRKAVSFYNREATADFIHLPLEVRDIKR